MRLKSGRPVRKHLKGLKRERAAAVGMAGGVGMGVQGKNW